jgi:hypothetical protein
MYVCYLIKYKGDKLPPFYIGSTSLKNLINGYRGSITSKKFKKIFKDELKNNFKLFEYEIISKHETRIEALKAELEKQIELDVVNSVNYFNESLASIDGMFGRDVKGELNPMYGKKHSKDTKEKIKIKRGIEKRYNLTDEHKEIISKTHKDKIVSDETKELISKNRKGKNSGIDNPMYGKQHTEETRNKISESSIGKVITDETRKKISEANKGKKISNETRKKISEVKTGVKRGEFSEEWKKKISEANKGKKMSDEAIENFIIARTGIKYIESECPHCGKIGGGGNMKRYHFENCKIKINKNDR